jgi:hypothetical protein
MRRNGLVARLGWFCRLKQSVLSNKYLQINVFMNCANRHVYIYSSRNNWQSKAKLRRSESQDFVQETLKDAASPRALIT